MCNINFVKHGVHSASTNLNYLCITFHLSSQSSRISQVCNVKPILTLAFIYFLSSIILSWSFNPVTHRSWGHHYSASPWKTACPIMTQVCFSFLDFFFLQGRVNILLRGTTILKICWQVPRLKKKKIRCHFGYIEKFKRGTYCCKRGILEIFWKPSLSKSKQLSDSSSALWVESLKMEHIFLI